MHNNNYTELLAMNYSLLSTVEDYLVAKGLKWKYK